MVAEAVSERDSWEDFSHKGVDYKENRPASPREGINVDIFRVESQNLDDLS